MTSYKRVSRKRAPRYHKKEGMPILAISQRDTGMQGGRRLADELVRRIQGTQHVQFLYEASRSKNVFAVYHEGVVYPVVYSKTQKSIRFLPGEVLDPYRKSLPPAWFEDEQKED